MKYDKTNNEETLKNKVAQDFFGGFDCTNVIKDIDFSVKLRASTLDGGYMLWAEAKLAPTDTVKMLTQLVLTIGKAKTFNNIMPPSYLGCFDCEKIAFIPYHKIDNVFSQNDFNWNVAPSDNRTREFKQVYSQIARILSDNQEHASIFNLESDEDDIRHFIRANFIVGKSSTSKIQIDKNNFVAVYNKWLKEVQPSIAIGLGWDAVEKAGIIDGDFYLADLLSSENCTLKDKLFVLLRTDCYVLDRKINLMGLEQSTSVGFRDKQKAHSQFWAKYERPPKEEYWDYIIERRDLLVPQDIRERKGSYYTPQLWVELSQKYIADVLGENWQDEYDIWDCCAGTGNLLAGLTNKYKIWASTLDKADVDAMRERIQNGANMLESHTFQFDFLNDDLHSDKVPPGLRDIIEDPKKRKKLVIYINPPYAEATSSPGKNKEGISKSNKTYSYINIIGKAVGELHAQFFARIYEQIGGCWLAEFSTLKILQAPFFSKFRGFFLSKLTKCFIVPANTFDNVGGNFPIGFKIWDCSTKELFNGIDADVYDTKGVLIASKKLSPVTESEIITKWLSTNYDFKNEKIGYLRKFPSDFQNNKGVYIASKPKDSDVRKSMVTGITRQNLIPMSIYLAVRKVIPATWINDRDQFLIPNDEWKKDITFQANCLTFTLFNNNVQSQHGANHWIPFTASEVKAHDSFESSFMTDFIDGKISNKLEHGENISMFNDKPESYRNVRAHFSDEATSVFDAGRELWKYYHQQPNCNVNASLYDIREYFQGRDTSGKMKTKSEDQDYNVLISNLRISLKKLAKKIEPKVYEYGFLKR